MISSKIRTSAGEQERLEVKELPRKMLNNNVLVKILFNPSEDVVRDSGIIISGFINTEWSDSGAMPRFGEVMMIPDQLRLMTPYNIGDLNLVEWGTEMEVEVGDIVYFGAMVAANCEAIIFEDELYLIIPYSRFICKKDGDDVIPVNGYCLVREQKKEQERNGLILVNKQETDRRRGTVIFNGRNNDFYFGEEFAVDADVEIGDDVVFAYNMFGYLENDVFSTIGEDVGYIQKRWIVAKTN